jgi:hypothetical protein
MKSNKTADAIKSLTAVIIGIVIIPQLWGQLEKKNSDAGAEIRVATERIEMALKEVDRVEAKRAAENLAAQDATRNAPQTLALAADRSEPSIAEMLAVFTDEQLDVIAENAVKYTDEVSPAMLVSYFKPEFKSMVHDLVFQSRDQSQLSVEQKQSLVDTQLSRAINAIDRAVAKKHI